MINKDELKLQIVKAEKGDAEARAVVREVLRPRKTDTVDEIQEKLLIYIRLIFIASLKFKDSDAHRQIDRAYAEQIHSLLNRGRPKYKGIIIVGYRESAKTSRVKFCDSYMTLYLPEYMDYINVTSENGSGADQFNMDMFNILAFSKIAQYFPDTISPDRKKKKESQTMSKFTTETNVTYASSAARISSRGNVKVDIDDDAEVETKRPKKVIFDDIENENTIRSIAATQQIGQVMASKIDGMDQVLGFWVLLGNYLSLRGNVHKYINKYKDDENYLTILISIVDGLGNPTWADKYVRTDAEQAEFAEQGIVKASVETIQRTSDNFQTEFLNNPQRSSVYFDDNTLKGFNEEILVSEKLRDENGLLIIQEPENGATYIMPSDSGKGNGGDQSTFVVIRVDGIRYEEVANFKSNKVRPEVFAGIQATIARKYNNALLIPENNYPGNETIAFLTPIYNNIYIDEVKIDADGNKHNVYGVNTNLKTKPEMFLKTKKVFIDRVATLRSQALYDQVLEYPSDEIHTIKQKDGSGGHFDLLQAFVIGLYKAGYIGQETKVNDARDAQIARLVHDVFKEDTIDK